MARLTTAPTTKAKRDKPNAHRSGPVLAGHAWARVLRRKPVGWIQVTHFQLLGWRELSMCRPGFPALRLRAYLSPSSPTGPQKSHEGSQPTPPPFFQIIRTKRLSQSYLGRQTVASVEESTPSGGPWQSSGISEGARFVKRRRRLLFWPLTSRALKNDRDETCPIEPEAVEIGQGRPEAARRGSLDGSVSCLSATRMERRHRSCARTARGSGTKCAVDGENAPTARAILGERLAGGDT